MPKPKDYQLDGKRMVIQIEDFGKDILKSLPRCAVSKNQIQSRGRHKQAQVWIVDQDLVKYEAREDGTIRPIMIKSDGGVVLDTLRRHGAMVIDEHSVVKLRETSVERKELAQLLDVDPSYFVTARVTFYKVFDGEVYKGRVMNWSPKRCFWKVIYDIEDEFSMKADGRREEFDIMDMQRYVIDRVDDPRPLGDDTIESEPEVEMHQHVTKPE